jgi:putative transposase
MAHYSPVPQERVSANHIHLHAFDNESQAIAKSMQLIAGRPAQEYNNRKQRKGAFWEDRYHATAVEAGGHLARCLVYIDLNRVMIK